ncbi:hypothetical protein [Sphingomonas sp. CFBP9019]|uniref:hypothetical protein n=2 Tax=unclassified Sphingomonas TaxID=196159 RepID=UPI002A6A4D13|nr:hypothetical protein [Sphingomonas sp. CFBP9019]MDY1008832.1 hypothetical protein [Sphingomonas sp. CFBP9019]
MKARRPTISVSMTEDENDLFRAEAARTDEPLNVMMIRLAKLGLEHQTQAEAAAESGKVTLIKAVSRDEPVGLLTADPAATATVPTSTGIVPVQAAATSVIASAPAPVPAPRTVIKPTPTDAPISFFERRQKSRWTPTPVGEAPVGSDKARWSAVGVLSAALALMVVPGNGMVAAAVSQTVLGEPGDGIAASNRLFEHYSHRAGPLRHWEATTRLADNQARVKACADRADRFSDYRRLAPCEIHVSSRRRAIEVGQGIVD